MILQKSTLFIFVVFALFFAACNEDYIPKPKGYPRVIFPEHDYQKSQLPNCPFEFEYPEYANIQQEKLIGNLPSEHPCWMDINFPDFQAKMHLSYKDMTQKGNDLASLIADGYKMNAKHVIKADYMEDSVFITNKGTYGIFYEIGGNTATSTQFLLTDSVHHFMWGSLYFAHAPNEDSIAPVVKFIRKDIDHFINSFQWEN